MVFWCFSGLLWPTFYILEQTLADNKSLPVNVSQIAQRPPAVQSTQMHTSETNHPFKDSGKAAS